MQITIGKVLSLFVAIGYIAIAVIVRGIHGLTFCLGLLVPLAFIWFPNEIGELTGYFRTGYVNVQTPGPIMSFIGWFLLVGLPVLLYFVTRHYSLTGVSLKVFPHQRSILHAVHPASGHKI